MKIDDAVLQKMAHGGATLTNPNVPNLTLPAFDVYTVKDDAPYGMSSITLSSGTDADMVTRDLTFWVAGPPASLSVSPMPDHMGKVYTTDRRVNFDVTALDESEGTPHIITSETTRTTWCRSTPSTATCECGQSRQRRVGRGWHGCLHLHRAAQLQDGTRSSRLTSARTPCRRP